MHDEFDTNIPYWALNLAVQEDATFKVVQEFTCLYCDRHGDLLPAYRALYSEEPDFPRCPRCDGKHVYRREVSLVEALAKLGVS